MKIKRRPFLALPLLLISLNGDDAIASDPARPDPRPYRVLVVVDDQWDDPASYNIDGPARFGGRTRQSEKDFLDVVTMLKIWGIPFDILRLDQQRLQINRFLNGVAEPNYACVVWMADTAELEPASANHETLRRAVEDYGMSLIAMCDYVKNPELADLIGISLQSPAVSADDAAGGRLEITGEHFITNGTVGSIVHQDTRSTLRIVRCAARLTSKVLGSVGGFPQLVVRDINRDTKVVWIGGGRDWFGAFPAMRQLFRRALVYGIGYGLFNDNFENAFIFIMDDMGASEHAYSLRWHYPTPSREEIVKYLVEPLEEYGFVMVQNVTCGYADPVTRMVKNPWTIQKFTDPFGNVQDYPSTKEGLDEGVRRGVFEVHAHRAWTHMTWDLDSPPGPWWDAPIDGERAHGQWYQETYDSRRDAPVPSNDMLFIYKVGRDAIERQFGVTPLATTVRSGISRDHDNGRLAAIAGYGVARWHYLGTDRVIQFSIQEMCPEQFTCHDLDLVATSDSEITSPDKDVRNEPTASLLRAKVVGGRSINLRSREWIEANKDKRWIGFNEYGAYLHSRIDVVETDGLRIRAHYDPHYCRHFAKHPSQWTLELTDRYRARLGKRISLTIDGETELRVLAHRQTITLPARVGISVAHIRPELRKRNSP